MVIEGNIPRFDEDEVVLPTAEPFPTRTVLGDVPAVREQSESSEAAEAPLQRKPRAPKQLPVDERQELHNADLAQWKANYVENMKEAAQVKKSHKAPALAKKNAAFWVMGRGIGGIGAGLGASKLESPLAMFSGNAMMEALTGIKASAAGFKRSRESEEGPDSDSEARRVRMRDGGEDEIGRGEGLVIGDDDGMLIIDPAQVSPW